MISNIKWHTNKLVGHIWPLPLASGYNQGLDHETCLMFGLALSQHTVTMYIYRTLTNIVFGHFTLPMVLINMFLL